MTGPYSRYRDSDVEWLGEVPDHWEVRRLSHAVVRSDEKVESEDADGMLYVGLEHVESWTGQMLPLDDQLTPESIANSFAGGDVLFGKLRPYLAKALCADFGGLCSAEFLVLKPHEYVGRYLLHLLLTDGFVSLVDSSTYGAKMPRASWDFVGDALLPLPPLDEQRAIAAFLDRETERIRAGGEEAGAARGVPHGADHTHGDARPPARGRPRRRPRPLDALVAKLWERPAHRLIRAARGARVPHAPIEVADHVALSRTVSARPPAGSRPPRAAIGGSTGARRVSKPEALHAGVEWLGEVPEHWEVRRLSSVIDCLDGKRIPLNGEERADRQGDYPYWGANGVLDHLDDWLFDEPLVLLGEDGAPFFAQNKRVAFSVSGRIWVNNHAHVLRPTGVQQEFLTHLLNITEYAAFIDGSTRDKLTQGAMNGIPVLLPPAEEQVAIVQHLRGGVSNLELLAGEVHRAIDRLQEYRTALITAAVTGKVDVRE